jgi:hypothetical protein
MLFKKFKEISLKTQERREFVLDHLSWLMFQHPHPPVPALLHLSLKTHRSSKPKNHNPK